jgi:hypothetical protein
VAVMAYRREAGSARPWTSGMSALLIDSRLVEEKRRSERRWCMGVRRWPMARAELHTGARARWASSSGGFGY